MLINRGGNSYQIDGQSIKAAADFGIAPSITAINLAEDAAGGNRFTSQNFTTTVGIGNNGTPTADRTISGVLSGEITVSPETDTVQSVYTPSTSYTINKSFNNGTVGAEYRKDGFGDQSDQLTWSIYCRFSNSFP